MSDRANAAAFPLKLPGRILAWAGRILRWHLSAPGFSVASHVQQRISGEHRARAADEHTRRWLVPYRDVAFRFAWTLHSLFASNARTRGGVAIERGMVTDALRLGLVRRLENPKAKENMRVGRSVGHPYSKHPASFYSSTIIQSVPR